MDFEKVESTEKYFSVPAIQSELVESTEYLSIPARLQYNHRLDVAHLEFRSLYPHLAKTPVNIT